MRRQRVQRLFAGGIVGEMHLEARGGQIKAVLSRNGLLGGSTASKRHGISRIADKIARELRLDKAGWLTAGMMFGTLIST